MDNFKIQSSKYPENIFVEKNIFFWNLGRLR